MYDLSTRLHLNDEELAKIPPMFECKECGSPKAFPEELVKGHSESSPDCARRLIRMVKDWEANESMKLCVWCIRRIRLLGIAAAAS